MSSSKFICVICDATTDSIIALQEHTRTHAMASKKSCKMKESSATAKAGDRTPCDVCPEVFDTPTKAIFHKFKKHPKAPNAYFCPWCGKQFPIKHILEKHTTSHNEPKSDKLVCEHCDAFFYNVTAAEYHVTYFHKREFMLANYVPTPPPSLKIITGSSGDLMSAYYCQYCGNEYGLKHNLRQHIKRVHMKADFSHPTEDMIQCKTCNALFCTVQAYDFHTSFHTDKDVFVISEEIRQQVISKIDQDFDVRRVRFNQDRKRTQDTVMKMKLMSDLRERMFSDIGHMSSLSPPPEDSDSDEDKDDEVEDPSTKKDAAENAITIGEFFEMNKSLLGDCVQTDDVEIQGQELTRKRTRRKKKDTESKVPDEVKGAGETKRTKREKCRKENENITKKLDETKREDSLCKRYGLLSDLKVSLERMDFDSMVNESGTYEIPKPNQRSELKNMKKAPVPKDDSNSKQTANGKIVSKESQNETMASKDVKLVYQKKIPTSKDVSSLNLKTQSLKDPLSPDGCVSTDVNGIKMDSEANDLNANGCRIRVVPFSSLKDTADKLPKKLIPVSSIPHNVKSVKMFRKVLVPKGVLKPGVKILTKGELSDLEQKGLIVNAPVTCVKK